MNRSPSTSLAHRARRLAAWQRLWLYAAGTVLMTTGLLWLAIHYGLGAGRGELPHPLEAWCMKAHGLASMAGIFVLGALSADHIPQGWRVSKRLRWTRQRNSGIQLCAAGLLLALSGYLLYYFAPEALRPAMGWAHALIGLAMGSLLVWHRQGRQAAESV